MTLRRFLSLWGPVLFLAGLLFFLSSLQEVPVPGGRWDKLAHFVAYGLLALAWLRALHGGVPALRFDLSLLALACTVAYAASDELHQRFVEGRDASVEDWVADTLGAFAALCAAWWMTRLRVRSPRTRLDSSGGA